jgi:peroxiredoxin
MGHRLPILIVLAFSAGACATASAPPAPPVVASPVRVPAVALCTLAGDHTELARLAGGRVALVSLWATWCESCAREMDALNRLDAKTAAGKDAVVIGVDVGEEPAAVAEFARKRGLRYAQLVDEDFAFADALGQRRVPTTLVVDRQGRIVFRGDALDGRSLEALRAAIAAGP